MPILVFFAEAFYEFNFLNYIINNYHGGFGWGCWKKE
jgi:hypothetical protein